MASTEEKKFDMKHLIIAALVATLSIPAFAHSKKEGMTPADGSTVAEVPETIALRFNEGMRLTKMDMTHEDHPSVEIDLSGAKGFLKQYELPIQDMGDGTYLFEWRGLGSDGHPMTGTFSFIVE